MVVHALGLLIGIYTAKMAMDKGWGSTGKLVMLYAVAELVFLLAHLGVLTLPFSHLVAEVLLLVGVLLVMMEAKSAKAMKK
jgi:hypothetical protein